MTKKNKRNREHGFHATAKPKPIKGSQQGISSNSRQDSHTPLVSICTVTYNRPIAVRLLEQRILNQTYPRDRLEWVLIDDSSSHLANFEPAPNTGLTIIYKRFPAKLALGEKRNVSNSHANGDIIVYMDDDDYYPPTRVEHAVQCLAASECLVAGSTILPILFVPENELWLSGPFSKNHATANTLAFKRELLERTRFEDEATLAEEKYFLKNYSIKMVQLEPKHTIICIGHDRNTFDKRQLIQGERNSCFKQVSDLNVNQKALIQQIATEYSQVSFNPAKPSQAKPSQRTETPTGEMSSEDLITHKPPRP